MLSNVKIPSHFQIIRHREDVIEIKSLYHYWQLTEGNGILVLSHRHHEHDCYHKQLTCATPQYAISYIIRHDEYISLKTC